MSHLDLATIRAMNAKRQDGYWQRTIAALCDEVERLRAPQLPSDLDAIRRIADSGDPIPPWLVRSLCDRVERLERIAEAAHAWADAIDRCDGIAAAEQTLREALEELKSWTSRA